MAETSKSKADLITQLADNITGNISPEDVRDIVASLYGSFGELRTIEGSATQAITGTPAKATGFTSNGLSVGCVVDHTTDDITVDVDGVYDIRLEGSFAGSSNDILYLGIYVNGSDGGLPYIDTAISTGGDVQSGATGGFLDLSAGDVLTVYVWSDTGGTEFIPHQLSLRAKRIG